MKSKSNYIISTVILSSVLMAYVDAIIQPSYLQKSLLKIILFLGIPLIYFVVNKDEVNKLKNLLSLQIKPLLKTMALGLGVYISILLAYMLFKGAIDLNTIKESLHLSMNITANNFIYVALYISFVNSLIEEFFFRGYAFVILKQHLKKGYAYVFSALLFSFYHVGMTQGWFDLHIYVLSMIGLLIGGNDF